MEELLNGHPSFRSGRCSIERVIRTNSDHLMMRMLRETELCNIGSYWNSNDDREFSLTRIEGFEGRVSFGCLLREDVKLDTPAEEFIESLYKGPGLT